MLQNSCPTNKNSQKISLLSQLFSLCEQRRARFATGKLQDIMEEEEQRYARKIRFYPSKDQKKSLNRQFGISRYYYNKTIEILNNDSKNRKEKQDLVGV